MQRLSVYISFPISISIISTFPCELIADVMRDSVPDSQIAISRASEANISYKNIPNITAVVKKYNMRHADSATTYWLRLSPIGMRVRNYISSSEVIKNFHQNRVWLVNSINKTSLEIDVQFYRLHFPDQLRHLLGVASISNVPGLEPCSDFQGKNNGKRLWRGQVVDEWICSSADGLLSSTQLFSQRWGLVVRVQHADLGVVELIDIKEAKGLQHEYIPDKTLNNIELFEFLDGNKKLDYFSP